MVAITTSSPNAHRNVALFGCGPHAKRIYIGYMVRHSIEPALIVDIEPCRDEILAIVKKNGWTNTQCYFVAPKDPYHAYSEKEKQAMQQLIKELGVTKAIVSTPPEVHIPYAILCLEGGLKVLLDKPLSAPQGLSVGNARQIVADLESLLPYDTGDNIIIQCQRRRHLGYQYVKQLVADIETTYGIQPHFIDIYHSDGRWDFPDEIVALRNHPYSYGYGKLLHSGYHFVDLACYLTDEFDYTNYRVFSYANSVHDFRAQLPDRFYKETFGLENSSTFPESGYGEIDSYSLIRFERDNQAITTVALNLLHTGFSRRSWAHAKADLYKGNGRLRHERVNIQIGPLMNIQVHSYQSTEVHDEHQPDPTSEGGLEHFDIHIYRNTGIIGGEPFEVIKLSDLEKDAKDMNDIGQNEYARHQLIDDFLADKPSHSNIRSHIRTNIILAAIAQSMYERQEVKGVLCDDL